MRLLWANVRPMIAGLCLCGLAVGCRDSSKASDSGPQRDPTKAAAMKLATSQPASASAPSSPIVASARAQVGKTTAYDPAYTVLKYPGGDVPIEKGVCTDVVIRALREARGMDLQKLVHEDMAAAFSEYPQKWRLTKPDANIDHRRVPNLMKFFERSGWSLPVSQNKDDYRPGDLVTCTVGANLPHIMVVSDRTSATGVPLVIHNIGHGAQEEDRLFEFPLTGHYRVPESSR